MNTVLLNTVALDGGIIIKKGSGGGGGGVTIKNQEKSVSIAENGSTSVTYDAGYTGLSRVNVDVVVPTEERSIEIVENGTTELEADNGYLSKVVINVNVPSGGGETPSYENGVYIQHIDGKLYTTDEWTTGGFANEEANGVAVVAEEAKFVIAKELLSAKKWTSNVVLLDGVLTTSDTELAKTDLTGKLNTEMMLTADTSEAGYSCANYLFANGAKGYLPALGEWCVALNNQRDIDTAMTLIKGASFGYGQIWSSTQASQYMAWVIVWGSSTIKTMYKDNTNNPYVRPFTTLDLSSSDTPGTTINNQEKVVEIVENGTTEVVADEGFTGLSKVVVNTNVSSSGGDTSRPSWTGHADVEGLKAIGWTDEDIAYYQENGVNWNEEDDEYHKVTDDNKALYGVLTADNISTYKDRIVYLPKIDTSGKTSMKGMFANCSSMVGIPFLDTSRVTNMSTLFGNCFNLVCIPLLDTSKVTDMSKMFYYCYALNSLPLLDTSKTTTMQYMLSNCGGLCRVPLIDLSNVTNISDIVTYGYALSYFKVKGLKYNLQTYCTALTKDSLIYIINEEKASGNITIKLGSDAYKRLAEDADVVAALANHPKISIAQ